MKRWQTFRQLPRMLQTLMWLGLALCVVGVAVCTTAGVMGYLQWQTNNQQINQQIAPSTDHLFLLLAQKLCSAGMALLMMSGACVWPITMYRARQLHPNHPSPRLDIWQTQIMAALALAVLPLCALALTPLISITSLILFLAPNVLNMIELFVLSMAHLWVFVVARG